MKVQSQTSHILPIHDELLGSETQQGDLTWQSQLINQAMSRQKAMNFQCI
jgi:hypothetical protein